MQNIEVNKHKERLLRIFSLCIVLSLCVINIIYSLTASTISFDGGWNAQLARNYAETGNYAVTYPSEITFCQSITTGQTVLVLSAIAIKLLGCSIFTISLIPLLYATAFLVILFILLTEWDLSCKGDLSGDSMLASAFMLIITYFAIKLYSQFSYDEVGEGATCFFLASALLSIELYEKHSTKKIWLLLSGACFAAAFITKTVAICFIVFSLASYFLFCIISKRCMNCLYIFIGAVVSFLLLEIIKLSQLSWSISSYINWWLEYIDYCKMLNTSGSMGIIQRIQLYSQTFGQCSFLALITLIIACAIVLLHFIYEIKEIHHGRQAKDLSLLACGVGGMSYIIANILFGEGAALYDRRLIIHFLFYFVYLVVMCYRIIRNEAQKGLILKAWRAWLIYCAIINFIPSVSQGIHEMAIWDLSPHKAQSELIDSCKMLPSGSVDIAKDWRFASAVTTISSIDVISTDAIPNYDLTYYIAGDDYVVSEFYDEYQYEEIYLGSIDGMQNSIVKIVGLD